MKRPVFQWGLSSMGAPESTLARIVALAAASDLDFVELRGLEGTLDLPALLAAAPPGPLPRRPEIRLLGSSLRLIEAGEPEIAEFARFAELAGQLGARYVRVFGGGQWGRKIGADQLQHAVGAVAACRRVLAARAPHVRMLLETYETFSSAPACQRLNHCLEEPLEILWDSHHTWRLSGETPEETWRQLGPLVRHVHYKDSVHTPGREARYGYVAPGRGGFPTAELFALLVREQFRGGLSLEWERLWHPDLPPLDAVLPDFQRLRARVVAGEPLPHA